MVLYGLCLWKSRQIFSKQKHFYVIFLISLLINNVKVLCKAECAADGLIVLIKWARIKDLMAIFQRKVWNKIILDDTQLLKVSFESTQNVQGHTEYVIRVQRGPDPDRHWHVCKRYNDFVALHGAVVQPSGLPIALPPKKVIGNMDRLFIVERQKALQNYLNELLMNPILASSLGVRRFLDPDSYVLSLQEQAVQHVAMAMRSEINYELLKPLPDIGWRFRKHYFLVKAKLNPRQEMALQWVEYGPDKHIQGKEIHAVLKLLLQVTHPYIHPLEYAHCTESGSFVIRVFHSDGTLRDLICGTKPKTAFLKKYGNPKQFRPLLLKDIQLYGRQIIEVLSFLKEKEIPYGHLHTSNIVLVDSQVRLVDVENGVLGLPSYYRPFFVQHKKINTMEAIDVYCLGHVLYEMAVGQPLYQSVCDQLPPSCPYPINEVIQMILSPDALRTGLPSLEQLKRHPLFADVREGHLRGALKIPTALRESLRSGTSAIEQRLRNEQKLVRTQKKITRVQERLTSEDEIKKRQLRLKEEQKANHASKNTKSPPRSESPTSTSTATSIDTVTTPPFEIKLNMPTLPTTNEVASENNQGRSALLSSICAFDKSRLRTQMRANGTGQT